MQRKFGPKVWCDIFVYGKKAAVAVKEEIKEEEEDLIVKLQREVNAFGEG